MPGQLTPPSLCAVLPATLPRTGQRKVSLHGAQKAHTPEPEREAGCRTCPEPGGGLLFWFFPTPFPPRSPDTLPTVPGSGRSETQAGCVPQALRWVREGGRRAQLRSLPAPELGLWQEGEKAETHAGHTALSAYHRSPVWCRRHLQTQSALSEAKRQDEGGKLGRCLRLWLSP